jgi:ribosomal protein S18 acetylase RimI-like enzyme
MTASERLSLEEEYENQKLWIDDNQSECRLRRRRSHRMGTSPKLLDCFLVATAELTFLVFDAESARIELKGDGKNSAETEEAQQLRGLAGDVNIFMLEADHAEDYAEASGAMEAFRGEETTKEGTAKDVAAATAPVSAEIMVMMAEPSCRRKGLAVEAVCSMMRYGMEKLGITTFIAKISEDNAASINLFTSKLGFVEAKRIKAFEEVHLVCGPKQRLKERVMEMTEKSGYKEVEYLWGQ